MKGDGVFFFWVVLFLGAGGWALVHFGKDMDMVPLSEYTFTLIPWTK